MRQWVLSLPHALRFLLATDLDALTLVLGVVYRTIEGCARCGGQLKLIASIEEPQLIAKILSHLERAAAQQSHSELPLVARGPPVQSSLL